MRFVLIAIRKISTNILKADEEILQLLQDLCPNLFSAPANYTPNVLLVNHVDAGEYGDDEEFNNVFIPNETNFRYKYTPDYDLLHISKYLWSITLISVR